MDFNINNVTFSDAFKFVDVYAFAWLKQYRESLLYRQSINRMNVSICCGIIDINYKNTSYIWKPGDDGIGDFLSFFCPKFFKTVPVGEHMGEAKYWPFALLTKGFYSYVYKAYDSFYSASNLYSDSILMTSGCSSPNSFLISLIFDFKSFKIDITNLFNTIKNKLRRGVN